MIQFRHTPPPIGFVVQVPVVVPTQPRTDPMTPLMVCDLHPLQLWRTHTCSFKAPCPSTPVSPSTWCRHWQNGRLGTACFLLSLLNYSCLHLIRWIKIWIKSFVITIWQTWIYACVTAVSLSGFMTQVFLCCASTPWFSMIFSRSYKIVYMYDTMMLLRLISSCCFWTHCSSWSCSKHVFHATKDC